MELEITRDVTGESRSASNAQNYAELFEDRYERLRKLIEGSSERERVPLNRIGAYEGEDVFLTGLVNDRRRTRKGDWIVKIEDSTGEATVWVKQGKNLADEVETIISDEVIGFDVKVPSNLSESRSPLVWGNKMYRAESWKLEDGSSLPKVSGSGGPLAVLSSDFHVGSTEFLEKSFQRFLSWLNGKVGSSKEKKLAERVEYLLVAGDAVDGGGVYPGQEKELEIHDVKKQYERLAEYLSSIPDRINVVIGPGNHDPVRLAEPQPAIPGDFGEALANQGVTLVGSPCFLRIGDVRFLIYHGGGFDDLVSAGIGLEYDDREDLLVETMRRGHLAPVYRNPDGNQAPTAPEREDYLTIDVPVDVFLSGHTHKFGFCRKGNTSMVLGGTFQEQTSYQKEKGITPNPGKVVLASLESGDIVTALDFSKESENYEL